MRNYLALFFLGIILIVTSCTEGEVLDIMPPEQVSGVTAKALNGAILLQWNNPTDEDFSLTRITYGEITIEVSVENNEQTIEDLINGTEYIFELYSVDSEGNVSDPVTVSATPDNYVTLVQGEDIVNGTFDRMNSNYQTSIVFNNSDCVLSMEAGGTKFIWEGTWSYENDTTFKFDSEYYTDDALGINHVANMVKRRSPAFTYNYSDTVFYVEEAYLKIDGKDGLLPGSYKSYLTTVSEDKPSYNDTVYFNLNISEEGTYEYSSSTGYTQIGVWDNQDLLSGRFLFATYKEETYLIMRGLSILYIKQ